MTKLFLALFSVIALGQAPARAQVFVKPSGQKAIAVRVQSLRANVEIVGAFAITHWQMEMQLENVGFGAYNEGVCDFVVARPTDAKVTEFAVEQWQKNLSGRVVERSLAAPRIAFRAAPNDPLRRSGLGASNSFRATIYPISSWNGVTLRGTWVQILPSVAGRSVYRLPLLSLKGATTRLPEINAKITVQGGSFSALSNNYGLPLKAQNGARVLNLGQKNYRVLRDLTVTLARPKTPLQSALLVAPDASKTGGHFALCLVADRALRSPTLTGRGVGATLAPKTVRAGEVALFSGVFEGDAAQIAPRLVENGTARDLVGAPTQNPVAAALWATQKIDSLPNTPANRAQIIALSKRYSVASRFTTWLAVGAEDLKIYTRALASSQLDPLVREYWIHLSDGQTKGARMTQLRRAIALISRANGLNEKDEIYTRLGSALSYAEWKGYYYDRAPRTKAEKRVARLRTQQQNYAKTLAIKPEDDLYGLREKLRAEYRKPHPDYAQLKKWETRFAQLYGSIDVNPSLRLWRAHLNARDIEAQTTQAEKAGDQAQLARLAQERIRNTNNSYFTNNIGDPPIYVSAPAPARGVVAVMPDGKVKVLDYNALQKRWEGNYDVPTTLNEGTYSIQIVIVMQDGTRRRYAMKFRVDTTAPRGEGHVTLSPTAKEGETVRLEIEHGGDVARVSALLPWGEKVALLPSTGDGNRFFLAIRAPRDWAGKAIKVTYILVDRAHNLTTIEAESVAAPAP